jgi:hypothetical protein
MRQAGEAVLFVTRETYKRFSIELSTMSDEGNDNEVEDPASEDDMEEGGTACQEVTEETEEEDEREPVRSTRSSSQQIQHSARKKRKTRTAIQARDHKFLMMFVTTEACRWIPWDEFFDNRIKRMYIILPPEV